MVQSRTCIRVLAHNITFSLWLAALWSDSQIKSKSLFSVSDPVHTYPTNVAGAPALHQALVLHDCVSSESSEFAIWLGLEWGGIPNAPQIGRLQKESRNELPCYLWGSAFCICDLDALMVETSSLWTWLSKGPFHCCCVFCFWFLLNRTDSYVGR